MYGIGLSELVVISFVILIFIRPKDLPAFFRKLGKVYAELKKVVAELTETKDKLMHAIEASVDLDAIATSAAKEESAPQGVSSLPEAPADSQGATPEPPRIEP